MNVTVEAKPSYAMAVVTLDKGESIVAEASSMVAMSSQLAVETTFPGASGGAIDWITSFFVALVRKYLAGERMVVNVFKAKVDGQQVMLAPAMIGDVVHVELDGKRKVTVQAGSFVACGPKVKQRLIWGGLAMLFSGEGAFFLEMSGTGDLLFNSYGGLEEVEIDGKYMVDSGHVAAWEGPVKYTIRKAGGFGTALLSGEGFVLEFSGKGKVWLQTRNVGSLVSWISPFFS
jgi:uncharacterized protein (TIGR00266 family)